MNRIVLLITPAATVGMLVIVALIIVHTLPVPMP